MNIYKEIKKEIENIKFEKFNYEKKEIFPGVEVNISSLLRKILILYNKISFLKKDGQSIELGKNLDEIVKNKFLNLNSNLNELVLTQILSTLKRSSIIYPLDYYTISNIVVFKEMILNESNPYIVKTFVLSNNGHYFNILDDIYFTLKPEFDNFDYEENSFHKKEIYVSKFISNNINYILKNIYDNVTIKPCYETDPLRYAGLTRENSNELNIYLNGYFYEILFNIENKKDMNLELVIHDNNNLYLYNIEQRYNGDIPIWKITKSDKKVWILSETVKENCQQSKH